MSYARSLARMRAAIDVAKAKGATLNSIAVIGQAALESGFWGSSLATKHNNLFGVKAGTSWRGPVVSLWTAEFYGGKYHRVLANWRVYPSWNECLVDYSNLIHRLWWFRDALPHADKPKGDGDAIQWIARLVDKDVPGELAWATGPKYVPKVTSCMAELDLL